MVFLHQLIAHSNWTSLLNMIILCELYINLLCEPRELYINLLCEPRELYINLLCEPHELYINLLCEPHELDLPLSYK